MGTPNDQTPLMVLGALVSLVALTLILTPILIYLAFGSVAVVYGWYALLCVVTSIGLLVYLLGDHDKPPPTPIRRVGRIT